MGKTRGSQSFIKNFFVLGFGSFIYLVIGLIGTPVITRLVDPAEYGQDRSLQSTREPHL